MLNPCCNDSQNPGFCSTWQGIGQVESFQSAVGIFFGWVALRAEGGMDSRTASGGFSLGYFNHPLYRSRKQDPDRGTI